MSDNMGLFVGGVALSICISSCNSLGMGLQKRVHKKLAVADPSSQKKFYQDKNWLMGLICMAFASIGSIGNYALLGQSRAAAMASITIVTNAIMARYMLNEILRWYDIMVIILIMVGVTIAVVYGSTAGGAPRTSLDDIITLLNRQEVYVATAIIVVYAIVAELYVRRSEKRGKSGSRTVLEAKTECLVRAFTAGLFSGSTGFFAKGVVVSIESMASTKSTGDLAKWQFWLFLIALPASIVLQLRQLNAGLRWFDATEVVPIYQSSIIFWGVCSGWVYYNENEALTDTAEVMFAVGCIVSVIGILMLLGKKKPVTSGDMPPDVADSEKRRILQGKATNYQSLPDDVETGGQMGGASTPSSAASSTTAFPPMPDYAGAPALQPNTFPVLPGVARAPSPPSAVTSGSPRVSAGSGAGVKPIFAGSSRNVGGGKLSEATPLTTAGAYDTVNRQPSESWTGFGGRGSDALRSMSVRLLEPSDQNYDAPPDATELVRRRADTSTTTALLTAIDVYAPALGSVITGERSVLSPSGEGILHSASTTSAGGGMEGQEGVARGGSRGGSRTNSMGDAAEGMLGGLRDMAGGIVRQASMRLGVTSHTAVPVTEPRASKAAGSTSGQELAAANSSGTVVAGPAPSRGSAGPSAEVHGDRSSPEKR